MFVSFFPRPLVSRLQSPCGEHLPSAFGTCSVPSLANCWDSRSAPAQDGGSRRLLVASIPVVLPLFYVTVTLFASTWMRVAPHPWVAWSILGSALILVHILLSGSSQRRDQRLVRAVLRSRSGGAFEIRARHACSILPAARHFCRNCLHCRNSRSSDQILRQSLHLSLAYRDERLLRGALAPNYGPLREPPSVFRKMQCDFATSMEGLGVNLVDAIMTLIAFLPVLVRLSSNVTELPLIGEIPYPLVVAALLWAVFGTPFLALIGIRLPGLEFHNQRVEAAYRKELVFGEDDPRPRGAAQTDRPFCGRAPKLFSGLSQLHVLQCRPYPVFADRQHLSLHRTRADYRSRQNHAWSDEPNSQCLRPGSIVVPIPCEFVAPNS